MQILSKNLKSIIGIVILLIVGFLAYGYFVRNSSNGNSNGAEIPVANLPEDFLGKEIFETYNTLHSINFDSKVFDSLVLAHLEDLTSALPPLSVGRDNPFAPLSGIVPASPVVPKGGSKGN